MRRLNQFAAVVPFVLIVSGSAVEAQAPTAPATTALVRTFADGRVNYDLVSTKPGRGWTAQVPRLEGPRSPSDVPQNVYAVQFSRVLVGRDVHVDVAVLYMPGLREVPVATVVVTPGARVVVNELERFGIKPIALSLTDVDPVSPYFPTVLSSTREIEISNIELLTVPYPAYRITLRNLSSKAAASYEVQSYRGDTKAISTSPRGVGGLPVMKPGESHSFTLSLATGSAADFTPLGHVAPRPLDVIEINAVRWEDGAVDGVSRFPGMQALLPVDGGRRLQLERIIAIYRDILAGAQRGAAALSAASSRLRALKDFEPEQLPEAQFSMMDMKRAALADIAPFGRDPIASNDAAAVRLWMLVAVERYEYLLARLAR